MDSKKTLMGHVDVKQLSHNLMSNECPWRTPTDKKKVRMVQVVVYYKDSKGKIDSVSIRCCCEHQDRAHDYLIAEHGLSN